MLGNRTSVARSPATARNAHAGIRPSAGRRSTPLIVACYGVGYAFAARQPLALWPIVLVGLLGKILGPLGFLFGLATGEVPLRFGWILLTNDLIWWVPFTRIVFAGWKRYPYFGAGGNPAAS